MFFKLFTGVTAPLESRGGFGYMHYDNETYSAEPYGLEMSKRGPVDPGCPASSIPLPDSIGKIFHPNGLGHEVIAAYALDAIGDARAAILGESPVCLVVDNMFCFSDHGSRAYASAGALNNNIDDFCSYVAKNKPSNVAGWHIAKTYYSGTLDEFIMAISLSDNVSTFSEDSCQTAISSIINGCDVPRSGNNPMNWKGGGNRTEGEYFYAVSVHRTNRPWPPPTAPTQSCKGWYKIAFQNYDIYGAGWATYDWGQQSLMKQVNPCCGSGKKFFRVIYSTLIGADFPQVV
jgi:hypothetical protein